MTNEPKKTVVFSLSKYEIVHLEKIGMESNSPDRAVIRASERERERETEKETEKETDRERDRHR